MLGTYSTNMELPLAVEYFVTNPLCYFLMVALFLQREPMVRAIKQADAVSIWNDVIRENRNDCFLFRRLFSKR